MIDDRSVADEFERPNKADNSCRASSLIEKVRIQDTFILVYGQFEKKLYAKLRSTYHRFSRDLLPCRDNITM